jgi:hypothetical protein
MDAIRDRRAKHRGIRNQRLARQSSGVASSSQSVQKKWMLLTTTSMIWIKSLEQLRMSKIVC